MKTFNTLSQLSVAKIPTGTPVKVLSPTTVEGLVLEQGSGLTLPSGNVFVPRFDDQEAITGRKTFLLTNGASAIINRYKKDTDGSWIASADGRTSNVFYSGQVWWIRSEVDFLPGGYTVTGWSNPTASSDILEVTTSSGSVIQFERFNGLSTQTVTVASGTQMSLITDSVNTIDKFTGKMVWSSTDVKPIYASGPLPGDIWVTSDGVTYATPASA